MDQNELRPARRLEPDPTGGWRGADLDEEERVDDDFIAGDCGRVYEPLMPEDEKLFPPHDQGGLLPSGPSVAVNDTDEPGAVL